MFFHKFNLISRKMIGKSVLVCLRQVGANNCVARYRTLSGGIGESPSPTHSSDYVDDDDDDDDLTTKTAVLNGLDNKSVEATTATNVTGGNLASNLKSKRSNHQAKASAISYQKATVHYVSRIMPSEVLLPTFLYFVCLQSSDAKNSPDSLNDIGVDSNGRHSNAALISAKNDPALHCSASSVESLPSASGSSECWDGSLVQLKRNKFPSAGTQPLVRSGSPNSSLSAEERPTIVPICRAKAIVDSVNFPFDKDALKFKVIADDFLARHDVHVPIE